VRGAGAVSWLVAVVRRRGRPVVRRVPDRVVRLRLVSVVPVMAAVEAVRDGGTWRRVVAEEVLQEAPEPVHRKGL
jgi:hypothetical protein